tara:strand:+ start:559 stop:738 length:180 start_codon:yes stop_codon:yes gene_type:complete
MQPIPKYKKGQKVTYLGKSAQIKKVNFCVYAKDYVYFLRYKEQNIYLSTTTYQKDLTIN